MRQRAAVDYITTYQLQRDTQVNRQSLKWAAVWQHKGSVRSSKPLQRDVVLPTSARGGVSLGHHQGGSVFSAAAATGYGGILLGPQQGGPGFSAATAALACGGISPGLQHRGPSPTRANSQFSQWLMLDIYSAVTTTRLPNFKVAHIPLFSNLHFKAWEELVQSAEDARIVDFLHFGISTGYEGPVPTPAIPATTHLL